MANPRVVDCLILFLVFDFAISSDLVVTLPDGPILGRTDETYSGNTFYAFQGIPYAAPPVGELRFEPPVPPSKWDDVLNATFLNVICHQNTVDPTQQSEDCLYLNVYTPALPNDSENVSLPVLLYIHGGGFVEGHAMQYRRGPEYLIEYDIVIVTFNYRLGAFGFLSTEDTVVPGNNGLKDQQLAIKWVYNNIHLFGGDNKKITIVGESAGGASVSYHLLNKKSEGLFRAAVLESGTSINPFALQRNARNNSFSLAATLNSSFTDTNDSSELIQYLRTVPAKDLQEIAAQIGGWVPVIEPEHDEAFITEKMYVLVRDGNFIQVPILMGINSEEYLAFILDLDSFKEQLEAFDKDVTQLVPIDISLLLDDENKTYFGDAIRRIYCPNEKFSGNLTAGVRYQTDNHFARAIIKYAELSSNYTNVYFYQFSYDGPLGNVSLKIEGAENVAHAEELRYLWRTTRDGYDNSDLSKFPEEDILTQHRMLTLWTNFIKTLNPTPGPIELLQNVTWPTVNARGIHNFLYLDINENLEVKNQPKEQTYKRWLEIYSLLGYDDFDTY